MRIELNNGPLTQFANYYTIHLNRNIKTLGEKAWWELCNDAIVIAIIITLIYELQWTNEHTSL